MNCAWCGKALGPGEAKAVPALVRWPAALAMAFVHGGLWAMEWLAKPFCGGCRARLVPAILAGIAAAAAAVAFLVRLWLRRP
jgi:hypothetical protein